ncbi:MAG: DUF1844 domain-containing protein [Planctomycetia bacterium]|nr:DUF1844 domain-containing protein [Planctomycetia bacterium]
MAGDDNGTEDADARMVAEGDTGAMQAPPATFEFLIHTLFTQALMALGRIPNPITRQSHRNPATAKHFIDTLAMLEQKTAGNLTTEERHQLEEIQHQLRMMFLDQP